jgi:hypothetical protein
MNVYFRPNSATSQYCFDRFDDLLNRERLGKEKHIGNIDLAPQLFLGIA